VSIAEDFWLSIGHANDTPNSILTGLSANAKIAVEVLFVRQHWLAGQLERLSDWYERS
jgi:hypothetical protein